MRIVTRTLTAAGLTAATTAAVLSAGVTPAGAENCVGLPTVPVTYVCLVSLEPTNALPTVDPNGGEVIVPSFCYLVGCTGDQPVSTPEVVFNDGTVIVATWNGNTYTVTGNPLGL